MVKERRFSLGVSLKLNAGTKICLGGGGQIRDWAVQIRDWAREFMD